VKGACEILGLDPLYVANEGKLVAVVAGDVAPAIIARMKKNANGADACIIGEVKAEPPGIVSMLTGFGGTRIVDARRRTVAPHLLNQRRLMKNQA